LKHESACGCQTSVSHGTIYCLFIYTSYSNTGIFRFLKQSVAGEDGALVMGYTGDDNDMVVDGAGLQNEPKPLDSRNTTPLPLIKELVAAYHRRRNQKLEVNRNHRRKGTRSGIAQLRLD
jgi:hypothetical protein